MKKLLFCLSLLAVATVAVGQKTVTVVATNMQQSRLAFVTPDYSIDTIVAEGVTYGQIRMADFGTNVAVGSPVVPVYNRTIEIPLCDEVQVEVVSAQVQTVDAAALGLPGQLVPRQPSRRKSDTTGSAWVRNDALYATDTYCGNPVVQVHRMGVSRDRNLAVVSYSPVRYNPATGKVELYSQVEVVLHYRGADIAATRRMKQQYHSEAFAPQADLLVSLPGEKLDHASSAPVRYLIVSHASFRGHLDDFVAWKRRKGFLTDIVYTDDAGVGTTSSAIAAYIKGQYTNATAENPAPTYLLLVGDVDQIPPFGSSSRVDDSHVTDLYYATWTDGDFLPDCYYGRFSAQNVTQLTPQIEKTLLYEQYGFEDPSYLSRAILVAGVDYNSPQDNAYRYGDPAMDYIAKTYCNAANGYSTVVYYKNNTSFSPTGVTVTGSSSASSTESALRACYNEGAGWVNYSAHGSEDSWSSPKLNVAGVNQMSNYGKPMFMIGNCCLSNHFNTSTCFGEALLRRGDGAGAVAYVGASNSSYWEEDFYWMVGVRSSVSNMMNTGYNESHLGSYDRMFHTHGEDVSGWRTTAGAMVSAGNMAVMDYDATSDYLKYYWEIYHVMGDPSVEPWLGEASEMPLQVNNYYYLGSGVLYVTAVPYAYIALTDGEGGLVVAAYANAQGVARLDMPDEVEEGEYELFATAQCYRPESRTIEVVTPSGAALSVVSFEADAPLNAGDTVSFSLRLSNLSEVMTETVSLSCVSSDMSQLLMVDDSEELTAVGGGATVDVVAAFRGVVNKFVPDMSRTLLQVYIVEDGDTSLFSTYVSLLAPQPEVTGYAVSGQAEPGGLATISVSVCNKGHATVRRANLALRHVFGMATVQTSQYISRTIAPGDTLTVSYRVAFPGTLQPTNGIPFLFEMNYLNGSISHMVELPYANHQVVDFETGDLSQITASMNDNPWVIDASERYAGAYSVRSARSLDNWQQSDMDFTCTFEAADTMSFYAKVSSENNGDWFVFSIDGMQQLKLSGEQDWARYAYPIEPGTHTFTFSYQKNFYLKRGSDAVWVDDISLPANIRPQVYLSDTVCQNSDYSFEGESVSTEELGVSLFVDSTDSRVTYLSLTVLSVPNVTITASSDMVSPGTPVLLKATGASHYEWSTGETTASIQVMPTATTTYTVTGYRGGCSATAQLTVQVTNAIDDAGAIAPRIYPNPASDWVNVELPGMRRFTVFDATGRTMTTLVGAANAVRVSVKDWAKGLYILRIETPDATYHRHIVLR